MWRNSTRAGRPKRSSVKRRSPASTTTRGADRIQLPPAANAVRRGAQPHRRRMSARPSGGSMYLGSLVDRGLPAGIYCAEYVADREPDGFGAHLARPRSRMSPRTTITRQSRLRGRRRAALHAFCARRLTGRLYIGPIDLTMAGQPVSLAASAPATIRDIRSSARSGIRRSWPSCVPAMPSTCPSYGGTRWRRPAHSTCW